MKLKDLYYFLNPKKQNLFLEYKVDFKPRYIPGKNAHQGLYEIINKNRSNYKSQLESFKKYSEAFIGIKETSDDPDHLLPVWNNQFLPGLDIIGLYGMMAEFKPKKYIEVGSGNSTRVAKMAKDDLNLKTEIISIDPLPRVSVSKMADKIIQVPFENLKDYSEILNLESGDILFIDNSHRALPNSDVTVFFLEIIPFLKSGVIVQIHDIYLPFDYPQNMCDRFYSEQYLLAVMLLSNPEKYDILLPNFFISEDEELKKELNEIWDQIAYKEIEKHGGSFWFKIKA